MKWEDWNPTLLDDLMTIPGQDYAPITYIYCLEKDSDPKPVEVLTSCLIYEIV